MLLFLSPRPGLSSMEFSSQKCLPQACVTFQRTSPSYSTLTKPLTTEAAWDWHKQKTHTRTCTEHVQLRDMCKFRFCSVAIHTAWTGLIQIWLNQESLIFLRLRRGLACMDWSALSSETQTANHNRPHQFLNSAPTTDLCNLPRTSPTRLKNE